MLRPWESEEIKRLLDLQQETNDLLRVLVAGQVEQLGRDSIARKEEFAEVTEQPKVEVKPKAATRTKVNG